MIVPSKKKIFMQTKKIKYQIANMKLFTTSLATIAAVATAAEVERYTPDYNQAVNDFDFCDNVIV